jgi:hypothetical protein
MQRGALRPGRMLYGDYPVSYFRLSDLFDLFLYTEIYMSSVIVDFSYELSMGTSIELVRIPYDVHCA